MYTAWPYRFLFVLFPAKSSFYEKQNSWKPFSMVQVHSLTDYLVAQQVSEMELVRQKVYNLEQNQVAIKQR